MMKPMIRAANPISSKLIPYFEYKDSQIPWIGKIPSHWKLERGKWLYQKMDRPIRPEDDVVTCFRDGIVTLRNNRRLRGFTESIKEIGYQGIRRGDLVIHQMDGFAGAIGVADSDGKGSPIYSVCQPRLPLDSFYYAQVLREMARSQYIMALARGIRERSTDFRYDTFGSQFYPVPPLEEQALIAKFITVLEANVRRYIRAKRRQIELLNEQKQAIIQQAVTRGLDPQVRLKPSGVAWLGDVPEHWEVLALKRCVSTKITDGPHETPELLDTGIDFVSAESMVDGKIDFNKRRGFISQESHNRFSKKCHPQKDDIFMCKSGATTGKVSIVETSSEFSVWSPLALIRAKRTKTIARFLFFVLQSKSMQNQIKTSWSAGTQPNLAMADMELLYLALPPIEQQGCLLEFIETKLVPIETLKQRIYIQINNILEFKVRLISDVVTGKLDVRAAAQNLPETLAENSLLELDSQADLDENEEDLEELLEEGENGE